MEPIKKLYIRLTECHDRYKSGVTKTDFANVWVECTNIERELDIIDLYKITNLGKRDDLHKLRKLMLARLGELETKVRRQYKLVHPDGQDEN
jgi:hypothetical protein